MTLKQGFELHGPSYTDSFSIVNIKVPHNMWLTEPKDVELWIQRNRIYRGQVTCGFLIAGRVGTPSPDTVQRSTIVLILKAASCGVFLLLQMGLGEKDGSCLPADRNLDGKIHLGKR